ncbi:unnamed protein product [Penicillium pancosmium]
MKFPLPSSPLLIGLACLLWGQFSIAAAISERIDLSSGTVLASTRDPNGVLSFKGIPYAAPPLGDLRWQSPRPVDPWTIPLNASVFGSNCWSSLQPLQDPASEYSEDCLTINVWTSANTTSDKQAVMVWIYGGGFQFGSSSQPQYNGQHLAQKDVVVVSFNYRLAALGFFALTELDKEGSPSGNQGLQDQIAALRWVNENIANFGGDPGRVTIFGQSAGSSSVSLLLASPHTKGLVQRAVMESGAFWDTGYGPLMNFTEARQLGSSLVSTLGVNSLAAMRGLSAQEILNATPYSLQIQKPVLFAPSVDQYIVPMPPSQAFFESKQADVDLMAGWTGAEGTLFLPLSFPHNTASQFEAAAVDWFGASHLTQFKSVYPDGPGQLNNSALKQIGDMQVREQTFYAAKSQLKKGASVFLYYYDYSSPHSPVPIHTAELAYVFGTLDAPPSIAGGQGPPATDQDFKFSDIIMSYWVNFAKMGDPNGGSGSSLAQWPKFAGQGIPTLRFTNSSIAAYEYPQQPFDFIEQFRTAGVLPWKWQSLNILTDVATTDWWAGLLESASDNLATLCIKELAQSDGQFLSISLQ